MDDILLRVHSEDLHEHVAQEVGECLESGLFTDLVIRCREGQMLHAHKLVLSSASPFLRAILENNDVEEVQTVEFPDVTQESISLLLEIVYNGVVEANMDELRDLILLAHRLYIAIPLSDELMETLELTLPEIPKFSLPSKFKARPGPSQSGPRHMLSSVGRPKMESGPPGPLRMKLSYGGDSSGQDKNRRTDHICPICKSSYSNIGNFKLHMKGHENDSMREQRNQMLSKIVAACYNANTSLYTCNVCNSTYNHSGNFKQHLLKHERETGNISALIVQENSSRPPLSHSSSSTPSKNSHLSKVLSSAMTDRVVRVDSGGQRSIYDCQHCGRSFNHAGNFKQHVASHMRAGNSPAKKLSPLKRPRPASAAAAMADPSIAIFNCPHCDIEFNNLEEMNDHISELHSSMDVDFDRPDFFRCSQCVESFASEALLQHHIFTFHLDNEEGSSFQSWMGDDADYSPSRGQRQRQQLQLQQQLQVRLFKCNLCGKGFQKRRKLNAHMKIHSAPEVHYRFPCDICGKKFTRQHHVNRHKLLHTGEQRTFSCPTCLKQFTDANKFKYHIKTDCEQNTEGYQADDLEEVENVEVKSEPSAMVLVDPDNNDDDDDEDDGDGGAGEDLDNDDDGHVAAEGDGDDDDDAGTFDDVALENLVDDSFTEEPNSILSD